jgi:hypothetical protein
MWKNSVHDQVALMFHVMEASGLADFTVCADLEQDRSPHAHSPPDVGDLNGFA